MTEKNKIEGHKNCECIFCQNNKKFDLPEEITEALLNENLVIFAGAGISTEARTVFPFTFYENIKDELKIKNTEKISFAQLMSKYCEKSGGRTKLLQKIKERFDYVKSFPELYRNATRFHHELSTLYHIENIITTNWDDFFEEKCGAIPIVTEKDFAFWNNPGRKVFKIHGSINNLGSIIVTENDYKKCYKSLQRGIIGSNLKLLLATKTIVFVGYSFEDNDFNKIYAFLKKEMGDVLPRSFIICPNAPPTRLNSIVIDTDATYFLETLKEYLVKKKQMIDDKRFEGILNILEEVQTNHFALSEIDFKKNPEIIYATSYQDGLIHSFERILALKKTGYYSHACNIKKSIEKYHKIRKEKLRKKKYFDIAYIDGYINGMAYLLADDSLRKSVPFYYVFGSKKDILTIKDFIQISKQAKKIHKASYQIAEKLSKQYKNAEVFLHHSTFL